MCIIIHAPAGEKLESKDLAVAYKNNPDGVGYMAFREDEEDGSLFYYQGTFMPEAVDDVDDVFDKHIDDDLVVHLRYKTTGEISLENCHPFEVITEDDVQNNPSLTNKVWVMHNGTFTFTPDDTMDTLFVVKNILRPMLLSDPNVIFDDWFNDFCVKFLGAGGRLTFITDCGDIQHIGHFHDKSDCKVSNVYSFNPNHRTPVTSSYPGVQQTSSGSSTVGTLPDTIVANTQYTGPANTIDPLAKVISTLENAWDADVLLRTWDRLDEDEKIQIALQKPLLLKEIIDTVAIEASTTGSAYMVDGLNSVGAAT